MQDQDVAAAAAYAERLYHERRASYEQLAWIAHLQDLGHGDLRYDSDQDRAWTQALLAVVRHREQHSRPVRDSEGRWWTRSRYGAPPTQRRPRLVAIIAPRGQRAREHKPAASRRTAARSSAASGDSGEADGDPDPPGEQLELNQPEVRLDAIAARLRARGGVG